MFRVHTAATLAAALLGAACVDGDYNRSRVFQEPLPARVDALAVGKSDVSEALEQLGAPVHVGAQDGRAHRAQEIHFALCSIFLRSSSSLILR